MKTLTLAAAFIIAASAFAQAQVFDITFTGSQSAATGEIDVVNGIAQSGSLTVTEGPNQGVYNLVTLTSPLINGDAQDGGALQTLVLVGGHQIFDDVVNAGSNPFATNVGGIEFANNDTLGFNLFSTGPGSYTLYDTGPGVYITDGGTATITAVITATPGAGRVGPWSLRPRPNHVDARRVSLPLA